VPADRLVALFLSLLVSIEAESELKRLNGAQTRLRNQFTVVLMEERSRYLSQASEIEERLFRVVQRSKPDFDIHFFTEESRRAHEKRYGEMITNDKNEPSNVDDSSEPKYCYCLRGSHGVMVACDGPNCRRKWFHLSCTDLGRPLSNYKTWFCIFCQPPISKVAEDTQEATATTVADTSDAEPEPKETQEADDKKTKERPPRGMVCDNCKFVWRSALALELRDCPNCGSYSVFAESPRRTTSPDVTDAIIRPDATGEEAIGQYFSERTNKFMSLYRSDALAESNSELPREVFPDPWSHLHASSSANSPRPNESPPALPQTPPPDTSDGEETMPLANNDLSTISQLKRMFAQMKWAQFSAYDAYRRYGDFTDMTEAKDPIFSFSDALMVLLRNESDDKDDIVKLQSLESHQSVIFPLCSSVQLTLEDVVIAIASKDSRQWAHALRMMEDVEKVGYWGRWKMYQDLVETLFKVSEGLGNDTLLEKFEVNLKTLLMSQESNSLQATVRGSNRRVLSSDFYRQEARGSLAKEIPQSNSQDPQVKDV